MEYKDKLKSMISTGSLDIEELNKNKVLIALVDIFEEEIIAFDYSTSRDLFPLLKIFDPIIQYLKNNKALQLQFYNRFTNIHNAIKNLIRAKPEDLSKEHEKNYQFLKQLINRMENTMLAIYYDNPVEYDPNKMEFISYIIFNLKYITFFEQACENFPHIVNSCDSSGTPLIEKVLDSYLQALESYIRTPNLGPLDDLIYYGEIMDIIIKSDKIIIDDYNKHLLLRKIEEFIKKPRSLSTIQKEKFSFFSNLITNTILGINEDESLEFLNYKYEIHTSFKESYKLEAQNIIRKNNDISLPENTPYIYTFDGEGAEEIDDGLSLTVNDGIYHLGIHIANPRAYIPDTSILFDEALKRTTSIYLSDRTIPIFPEILSKDLMSLKEGKPKYCKSYYYDIDARTGELLNFQIKNEICIITKNLTYKDFDYYLLHGCDDPILADTIINLYNILPILNRVFSEDPIYKKLHSNPIGDSTKSENIIASAMIYNNFNLAKLFSERKLPYIYRCHQLNPKEHLELSNLQERLKDRTKASSIVSSIEMIKNIFPKAFYSRINFGHFGLGTAYYSHATSPLRRAADNIVNRCIDTFILSDYTSEQIKRMEEFIDQKAEIINEKRVAIDTYSTQYEKTKRLIKN